MPPELVISNDPNAFNTAKKLGEYWYDESAGVVYTFKTMVHNTISASNYKALYPEVGKFNVSDPAIKRIFPRNDSLFQDLSAFSFLGTGYQINIVETDKPFVSFNKETKTFSYTFLASDIAGYKYLFTYYFKRQDEELIPHNVHCIKPELDIFNSNFTDWWRLSTQFIPSNDPSHRVYLSAGQKFGTDDWISFETAVSADLQTPNATRLLSDNTDIFSHGQLFSDYVYRNDSLNTIWLGCSSVVYLSGFPAYPFPVMYNTSYVMAEAHFHRDSDIEVYVDMALYRPEEGFSTRAVYTAPNGWDSEAETGGWAGNDMQGTWSTLLTTFTASKTPTAGNQWPLDPTFQPGNGFSIFFYNINHENSLYTGTGSELIYARNTYENSLTNFNRAGVGESLGYKPYTGLVQLSTYKPTGMPLPTISAGLVSVPGIQSAYAGVGFDIAGGFSDSDPLATNVICIKSGAAAGFEDLYVSPALTGINSLSANLPNVDLYQKLEVEREVDLKFNTYKVSLENCGTVVKVGCRPHGHKKFYEYGSATLPSSALDTLSSVSAIGVGMAFSTSDKTLTCELRSINTYGRYYDNPRMLDQCCDANFILPDEKYENTGNCPIYIEPFALRTERTDTPIVTDSGFLSGNQLDVYNPTPLSGYGMNYIINEAPKQ